MAYFPIKSCSENKAASVNSDIPGALTQNSHWFIYSHASTQFTNIIERESEHPHMSRGTYLCKKMKTNNVQRVDTNRGDRQEGHLTPSET